MSITSNPLFLEFEAAVNGALNDGETVAILCDNDGTLSPIVPVAQDARPLPKSVAALASLSRQIGVTAATVSGRPAGFLLSSFAEVGDSIGVDIRNIRFIGHYGLQWIEGGAVHTHELVTPYIDAIKQQRVQANMSFASLGYDIEDKEISFAIHWRNISRQHPDREHEYAQYATTWAREHAKETGLDVKPGKMVVEIVPPLKGFHKGRAVIDLAQSIRARAVLFIGDDKGDCEAFEVLDRLERSNIPTLKVVVNSPELPDELRAHATGSDDGLIRPGILVDGPQEVAIILSHLARSLDLRRGWGQSR